MVGKGRERPGLKVVVNEVSGNEVIQSVKYRDIYRGLDASTISVEMILLMCIQIRSKEKFFIILNYQYRPYH